MKRFAPTKASTQSSLGKRASALVLVALLAAPAAEACDTWVALPDATRNGATLLAKNSDRPLFDCQPLLYHGGRKWPEGASIDLGRISIPQAGRTFATLGSSPYWCWGYEEGMNEHGVAIGNEGVFTKPLAEGVAAARADAAPASGPTGMDLVRLGLERGRTAREALEVMAGLVERYGQFGSGLPGAGVEGAYDNSFLIADAREAWVLETAGTRWTARRIDRGTASISNALAVEGKGDLRSRDLVAHAVEKGWWPKERAGEFDFAGAYSDDSPEGEVRRGRALVRARRSAGLLRERGSDIDPFYMMRIARDRSTTPSIDLDVTASSCVAVLPKGKDAIPVLWWCPAVPSSGCFVPFFVDGGAPPEIVSRAGARGKRVEDPSSARPDSFSADSYWWAFRDLCDAVNAAWSERNAIVRASFDSLEAAFAAELPGVAAEASRLRRSGERDESARVLRDFSARCVGRALDEARALRARFAAEEPIGISEPFRPFVGVYKADFGTFQGREFKVIERSGRLAVDIPGQAVVDLADPDDEGIRRLVLTDRVAFSFVMDSTGVASALRLHQTTILTRAKESPASAPDSVEARYRPYVGSYTLPIARMAISMYVSGGRLMFDTDDEKGIAIDDPDEKGRWRIADDPSAYLTFDEADRGSASRVRIRQTLTMPRK